MSICFNSYLEINEILKYRRGHQCFGVSDLDELLYEQWGVRVRCCYVWLWINEIVNMHKTTWKYMAAFEEHTSNVSCDNN